MPVKLQAVTLAAKLLVLSPAHGTLLQLAKYVFALARYDQNYDVRDRGRMLQQLIVGVVPSMAATDAKEVGGVVLRRAQVRVVLFEGKAIAPPLAAHDDAATRRAHLGTLGLVLGRDVPHARLLPDWLEHGVESSLRRSPDDDAPSTRSAAAVVTAIGNIAAPSSSRPGLGTGGHSTPIVVLTPAGSDAPSPAGSVPNKAGWTDLDKFYASESEEEEEDEDEEEESEEGDDDEDEEDEEDEGDGERSGAEDGRQSGDEEVRGAGPGPLRTFEEEDEVKDEDGSDVGEGSSLIAPVGVR